MKSTFALLVLACLVSCGGHKSSGSKPPVIPPEEPVELTVIQNVWINDNQVSVFQYLDLRNLTMDGKQPSSNIIDCNGSLGNSGKVNGVDENELRAEGDTRNGTIQMGHLSYVGATNYAACRAASKEKYTFTIVGQTLILQNIGYCASHACANDGVEVFQLDEAQL